MVRKIHKQASNNFMEIQNVTFAKTHGSLVYPGFREISSRENQCKFAHMYIFHPLFTKKLFYIIALTGKANSAPSNKPNVIKNANIVPARL